MSEGDGVFPYPSDDLVPILDEVEMDESARFAIGVLRQLGSTIRLGGIQGRIPVGMMLWMHWHVDVTGTRAKTVCSLIRDAGKGPIEVRAQTYYEVRTVDAIRVVEKAYRIFKTQVEEERMR